MTQEWTAVFSGPLPEVQVLQIALEARGITTFIPDETTKVVDPFITGANPLATLLQVPRDSVEEATALIADLRKDRKPRVLDATAQVVEIGRRIRWCFIIPMIGWLIGTYLGFVYLGRVRRMESRPAGFGATVGLWCLQLVLLAAFPLAVVLGDYGPLAG